MAELAEEEGGEGFESPVAFLFSDLATPIITPLLTLGSFFVLSGQTFPGKRGYLSDSIFLPHTWLVSIFFLGGTL